MCDVVKIPTITFIQYYIGYFNTRISYVIIYRLFNENNNISDKFVSNNTSVKE